VAECLNIWPFTSTPVTINFTALLETIVASTVRDFGLGKNSVKGLYLHSFPPISVVRAGADHKNL